MTNASKKTLKPQPLTEEQKKHQQALFLMQKREAFAQGILYNLCNNPGNFSTAIEEPQVLVDRAVKMADLLIEALVLNLQPDWNKAAEE